MPAAPERSDPDVPAVSRGAMLWRHHRFTVLLAALMLYMLSGPALAGIQSLRRGAVGLSLVLVAFTVMLTTTILAVQPRRQRLWLVLSLAAPTVAMSWLELGLQHRSILAAGYVLTVAFLGTVFVMILRHVLRQRDITFDVISAALCAYLFLGVAWASVYAAIELFAPGSFHFLDDSFGPFHARDTGASTRRLYFSFVTLLTLGYGDIVPVGSLARLFAVMEAFCGQVFLVVLIARLVGVHVGQSMLEDDRESSPPRA